MRLTFACCLEMSADRSMPGFFDELATYECSQGIDRGAILRLESLGSLEFDQSAPEGQVAHIARRIAEELADVKFPGWRDYGRICIDQIPNRDIGPMEGVCESTNPAVVCPKCSKPMVRRSAGRGPFWGCTDYPACKGLRPISK